MILRRSWRTLAKLRMSGVQARLAAALLGLATIAGAAAAQDTAALRRDVERRFEVLPLQNGLALRPKAPSRGARSVELTDGIIAIDGMPATGAELRDKLGPDAEIIIRLSYLDSDARRTLFTSGGIAEAPPAGADTTTRQPRTRRSGDRIRFGGSVTVDADEIVAGDTPPVHLR